MKLPESYSNKVLNDDTLWRYQVVLHSFFDTPEVCVYQVAVDRDSPNIIKYIIDPEPVQLVGSSIEEINYILTCVHYDMKQYGVISDASVINSLFKEEDFSYDVHKKVKITNTDSNELDYYDSLFFVEEIDEETVLDMLDQQYDSDGKVLDLVSFMKGSS